MRLRNSAAERAVRLFAMNLGLVAVVAEAVEEHHDGVGIVELEDIRARTGRGELELRREGA